MKIQIKMIVFMGMAAFYVAWGADQYSWYNPLRYTSGWSMPSMSNWMPSWNGVSHYLPYWPAAASVAASEKIARRRAEDPSRYSERGISGQISTIIGNSSLPLLISTAPAVLHSISTGGRGRDPYAEANFMFGISAGLAQTNREWLARYKIKQMGQEITERLDEIKSVEDLNNLLESINKAYATGFYANLLLLPKSVKALKDRIDKTLGEEQDINDDNRKLLKEDVEEWSGDYSRRHQMGDWFLKLIKDQVSYDDVKYAVGGIIIDESLIADFPRSGKKLKEQLREIIKNYPNNIATEKAIKAIIEAINNWMGE